MAKEKLKVLAAAPTYDGTRYNAMALLALQAAGARILETRLSLLARGFNEAWTYALNDRSFTHFLMIHADVAPTTPNWVTELLTLSLRYKATVLSVVLPIKTRHGLTSTAIETDDPWNPRKLSKAEVAQRPGTWTEEGLLVNTGLMVVDLRDRAIADSDGTIFFEIQDRIRVDYEQKRWVAESRPEDWEFSRKVRAAGGSVYATRAIEAGHYGTEVW